MFCRLERFMWRDLTSEYNIMQSLGHLYCFSCVMSLLMDRRYAHFPVLSGLNFFHFH